MGRTLAKTFLYYYVYYIFLPAHSDLLKKKSLKEKRKEEEETTKPSWIWQFMSVVPATEEAKMTGSFKTRC